MEACSDISVQFGAHTGKISVVKRMPEYSFQSGSGQLQFRFNVGGVDVKKDGGLVAGVSMGYAHGA